MQASHVNMHFSLVSNNKAGILHQPFQPINQAKYMYTCTMNRFHAGFHCMKTFHTSLLILHVRSIQLYLYARSYMLYLVIILGGRNMS